MSSSEGPLVTMEGVWFWYSKDDRRVDVLQGASLTVDPGESVSLMGRSGSGKSTLLSIVAGLRKAASGRVEVCGERLDQAPEETRSRVRLTSIGLVFQDIRLLPSLTAEENVSLAARLNGVSRRESKARAMDLLDSVGLGGRTHHRPAELSGGEQQRVGVARALVNRPQLVLADEPTAAVDKRMRAEIADVLLATAADSALVVVTHDPALASLANRTMIVDGGTVKPAR